MDYEFPKINKCCCCIPLEYGVIISTYLKIIIELFVLYVMIINTILYTNEDLRDNTVMNNLTFTVILVMDVIMNIIFLVSSRLGNYKLMSIFYCYILYILGISMLGFILNLFSELYFMGHIIFNPRNWKELIRSTAYGIIANALQFYFVLMVRMKVLNLMNKRQFKSNEKPVSKESDIISEPRTSFFNPQESQDGIELQEIVTTCSKKN